MRNYSFYTPPMLAEYLLELIPIKQYNNIIDICCGSWNLLTAAKKHYPNAHYVGVDVDAEAGEGCFKGADFFCMDGRKFAIEEKKKYDMVLSNPPFGYLKEEERILENSDRAEEYSWGLKNKRYENEMVQANLLLVKKGGVLLFILPSTFIEGDTYLSIRKELCNRYTVDFVIKLPVETFGAKKIKTYALILTNCGEQNKSAQYLEVYCNHNSWGSRKNRNIDMELLKEGKWTDFIDNRTNKKVLKDEIDYFRGNISSAQMSKTGKKVFHCSSKVHDGKWEPSVRYCDDKEKIKNAKLVFPGDIIINRVGRCAKYWCVSKEKAMVSDCLIVVRKAQNINIYEKMMMNSTDGSLNISTKGVATKYITMSDVLELL